MTAYVGSWFKTIADLFGRNSLTIFGASLTTLCVLLMSALTALAFLNIITTPYLGILIFLILPALFVTGLFIIPIGALWDRYRRAHHTKQDPRPLSVYVIDLREPRTRRALALVSFLTVINIAIVATVTYKGFIYTESVPFCGQVCHTVMEPEFTAHSLSPHSRVRCTECHIGPGAPWFVRSKISGLSQIIAVLRNSYERPIPTPVKNLRPSRDTCEQCHWPERFAGDRIKVKKTFKDDELNTPLTTALLLHIGGGNSPAHGIHSWHIQPGIETRYLPTDESRQKIALVRVKNADGTIKNFASADFKKQPEEISDESMRVMDCIDCHNRPTHILKPANQAMDAVLADETVDKTLPFLKKTGLEAILSAQKTLNPSDTIRDIIIGFYKDKYPNVLNERAGAVEKAISELLMQYARNVFPAMNVQWGTYPDNLGHNDFPGCFRCHDDEHTAADGNAIPQDCTICHSVLTWNEEHPQVLQDMGLQ